MGEGGKEGGPALLCSARPTYPLPTQIPIFVYIRVRITLEAPGSFHGAGKVILLPGDMWKYWPGEEVDLLSVRRERQVYVCMCVFVIHIFPPLILYCIRGCFIPCNQFPSIVLTCDLHKAPSHALYIAHLIIIAFP